MRAIAQRAEPGYVIGMQMRVDRLDKLQIELADELQIAIDLFQDRIDDQRLAAGAAGQQIGIGSRRGVKGLAENHEPSSSVLGADILLHGLEVRWNMPPYRGG